MLAGTEEELPAGQPVTQSLRVLLEGLVDYAGLFPPAALPLDKAVANYQSYRQGEFAWALGRFVVPAAKLKDVPANLPTAVLAEPGDAPPSDVLEIKAASAGDVAKIAAARGSRTIYVESADQSLLPEIKRQGLRAKIRTGGTTPEAFPATESVADFIRTCAVLKLPFKATAGLHHPLRCRKPLTYEPDARIGAMHGFLNVFLSAAMPQYAAKILVEENPRAFAFDDGGVWWRDCRVTIAELARVRSDLAISFGSCSFEEPINDLKELGWL